MMEIINPSSFLIIGWWGITSTLIKRLFKALVIFDFQLVFLSILGISRSILCGIVQNLYSVTHIFKKCPVTFNVIF